MKKILLSLAVITSFISINHASAADNPTVLYFHDEHNMPLKDFSFTADINNEPQHFSALDDGYKAVNEDIDAIEIAGKSYQIRPGLLNEIEIIHSDLAEDSKVKTEELSSTESPDDARVTVHTVDLSYSPLEDGTKVYLKLDHTVVDETEVKDGIATFDHLDKDASYEVSYDEPDHPSDKPVIIKAGEEKYLVYDKHTHPIKSDRMAPTGISHERLVRTTVHRAPDDTPPLLARARKVEEEQSKRVDQAKKNIQNKKEPQNKKESQIKHNTQIKKEPREQTSSNVKPQLPVNKSTVNPMKQLGINSDTNVGHLATSRTDSSRLNNSSVTTEEPVSTESRTNTSYPTDGDYASDSSYASDGDYHTSSSSNEKSTEQSDTKQTSTVRQTTNEDKDALPSTGEAMGILLPLAGLITVSAGIALLYFTRKSEHKDH
ncbi:LPXTG cell wall anchor domain-containing protein [Macrococcus equi]|uniref:LPXTG cell wall anchor domain-containing protein n=1 Tax=Macrococcus equi TaxID=3395462 RepID=UPI0039BE1B91